MTQEEQNLIMIRGVISMLPEKERNDVNIFADSLRAQIKGADETIAILAFSMVGMEMQLKAKKGN